MLVPDYFRSIPFFDAMMNVSPPRDDVIHVNLTDSELRSIALILSLEEVEYSQEQIDLLDYLGISNIYNYPSDMWSILVREQIKLWISSRSDVGYQYLKPLRVRQSSLRYKANEYLGKYMSSTKIVMGGNRIASTLHGMSKQLHHSIEVFFICSRDEAIEVIKDIRRDCRTESIKYTSTHIVVRNRDSRISFSFRRALYKGICHVAHSIDTDPFCVVTDGVIVYGTERYLHSVKARTSYYHPNRCNLQHHNDLLFSHCMLYELMLPEYSGYLRFKDQCHQFIRERIMKVYEVDNPITSAQSLSGILSTGDRWYYVTPAYCAYMDLDKRHEFMGFFGSCNNVLTILEGRLAHHLNKRPRTLTKDLAYILDCLFMTVDAVNGQWASMSPEDIVESTDTQFISKLLSLYYEVISPRDYDQIAMSPLDQLYCAKFFGYCPRIVDHRALMDLPKSLSNLCMNRFNDITRNEINVLSGRKHTINDSGQCPEVLKYSSNIQESSDLVDVHYIPCLVNSGMYHCNIRESSTGCDLNDITQSITTRMRLSTTVRDLMTKLSIQEAIKRVLPNSLRC